MNKVAEILGVELREEFKIVHGKIHNDYSIYRLTRNGLEQKNTLTGCWCEKPGVLENLLCGYGKIKKLDKDSFYCGDKCWTLRLDLGRIEVFCFTWHETNDDYTMYNNNLCFHTEEKAEEAKQAIMSVLNELSLAGQ